MVIYKITNKINNKVYIGQTRRPLYSRWREHCSLNGRTYKSSIYKAIIKYGKENFTIEEIDGANSQSELNYLEDHYINIYNTLAPNGYNITRGGRNDFTSEETRQKMSDMKKGAIPWNKGKIFVDKEKRNTEIELKRKLRKEQPRYSKEGLIKMSRARGGCQIKATHLSSGEIKIYETVNSTKEDGFNPSNVVSICKKSTGRVQCKNWTFEYIK